jgi:hypothetical protein
MSTSEKIAQERAADKTEEFFAPENELVVVHTTAAATRAALHAAARLGSGLYTHIRLIAPRIVPYPLSLASPPVSAEFTERFLLDLVAEVPTATRIDIRNCRDAVEMIRSALKPGSLVVIGKRAHWWLTAECRLVRTLRKLGHTVVLPEIH